MKANNKEIEFHSSIAPLIKQFIQEKRVCGYKYDRPHIILKRLDNFLSKNLNQMGVTGLPRLSCSQRPINFFNKITI